MIGTHFYQAFNLKMRQINKIKCGHKRAGVRTEPENILKKMKKMKKMKKKKKKKTKKYFQAIYD